MKDNAQFLIEEKIQTSTEDSSPTFSRRYRTLVGDRDYPVSHMETEVDPSQVCEDELYCHSSLYLAFSSYPYA